MKQLVSRNALVSSVLCKSYICFSFVISVSFQGVIVQKQLCHNGHGLDKSTENVINRINRTLMHSVATWIGQHCTTTEVLLKATQWAKEEGHHNVSDRCFYLTPKDVWNIQSSLASDTRLDENDSISVDRLVKSDLQKEVMFYQPLFHSTKQTLIIVLQGEQLAKYRNVMVFLDATYKVITAYGYTFYALIIQQHGRGIPVAYFIVCEETTDVLEVCLQTFEKAIPGF